VHRSAVYVSWWQKGVEGERPHILQIIPAWSKRQILRKPRATRGAFVSY
jgi:hypothetical protein